MQATAEIQIVPVGAGISVRQEVQQAVALLERFELTIETHAAGTDVEGDLETILTAVRTIHETLHAEGTARLLSYIKLETRTDKTPTLASKRLGA